MVNNGATSSGLTSAAVEITSIRTPNSEDIADSAGSTRNTAGSQLGDHEPSFAREAVKRIEPIIDSFRAEKVKKSQAIFQIGQILAAESIGDERLKSDALEQYAGTLDRIEALVTSANEHGTRVAGPMHERRVGETGKRSRGFAEFDRHNAVEPPENDVDGFLAKLSKGINPGVEHGEQFEQGDGLGDESDREHDDELRERGRSNKKQRIFESEMPWFSAEQRIRKSSTNPSCNKTKDIIETFQRYPATVKRWIRCATSAPAGFPSSEWDALIKGESVDIDTVFSSLHHVNRADESVGRVGATEIQFGRPKPAAKVETSNQWTSAYNLIVKATAFLFPTGTTSSDSTATISKSFSQQNHIKSDKDKMCSLQTETILRSHC